MEAMQRYQPPPPPPWYVPVLKWCWSVVSELWRFPPDPPPPRYAQPVDEERPLLILPYLLIYGVSLPFWAVLFHYLGK